jgi:plasmid stability protein
MDSVLIRVPDGIKQRLANQAKASGRSMNAELVALITKALGEPDEMEYRALRDERRVLVRAEEDAVRALHALRERRRSVDQALRSMRGLEATPDLPDIPIPD